jgi:hypothetical protein
MKRLFKNFRWAAFFSYFIIYTTLQIIVDLIRGKFNESDSVLKLIVGYIVQGALFALIMSMIFGKKILEEKEE